MSSWGCPQEVEGVCQRVRGALCDPGMLGCVVQGKVETLGEPRGPRRPVRASAGAGRSDREEGEPEDHRRPAAGAGRTRGRRGPA